MKLAQLKKALQPWKQGEVHVIKIEEGKITYLIPYTNAEFEFEFDMSITEEDFIKQWQKDAEWNGEHVCDQIRESTQSIEREYYNSKKEKNN